MKSADAGVETRTERIGAYLSRKVDLQCRVDGRHLGILGDDEGVVGVSDVFHQYAGIVVNEVINAVRAHQEGGDHLPFVYLLVGTVYHARFHEGQYAVGEHFGVYAEVLVDAHLEARSVFDERCAVAAYGALQVVRFGEVLLDERRVVLDEEVYLRGVDERIAERPRDMPVHDRDDRVGALHGRQRGVYRGAEGDVAVSVGSRDLYHGHVARQDAVPIEALRLAQEDRYVVGETLLGDVPDIPSHEERVELENPFHFGDGVEGLALGVEVMDMDVLQLPGLAPCRHRTDEYLRYAGDAAQVDVVTGFDDFHRLFGCRESDGMVHGCNMFCCIGRRGAEAAAFCAAEGFFRLFVTICKLRQPKINIFFLMGCSYIRIHYICG